VTDQPPPEKQPPRPQQYEMRCPRCRRLLGHAGEDEFIPLGDLVRLRTRFRWRCVACGYYGTWPLRAPRPFPPEGRDPPLAPAPPGGE
jgi:hypothetical protein